MAFSSPPTLLRVDSTSRRFLTSCTTSFLAPPIPMSIGLAEQLVPAPPVWLCSSSLLRRRRCSGCSWLLSARVSSRLPDARSRRSEWQLTLSARCSGRPSVPPDRLLHSRPAEASHRPGQASRPGSAQAAEGGTRRQVVAGNRGSHGYRARG